MMLYHREHTDFARDLNPFDVSFSRTPPLSTAACTCGGGEAATPLHLMHE